MSDLESAREEIEEILSHYQNEFLHYKQSPSQKERVFWAEDLWLLASQLLEETSKLVCLEKGEEP